MVTFSSLVLTLLLSQGPPAAAQPSTPQAATATPRFLHPSLEPHPYYDGKLGFPSAARTKEHAYKEFMREVRSKRIDPSQREYYSYIYTAKQPAGASIRYFHTPWATASYLGLADGCDKYAMAIPFPEGPELRRNTVMHSHPTREPNGEGPSRMDVLLASRYRKSNGQFRYLYLINNRLKLVRYKALRAMDENGSALRALPFKPVLGRDWLD